MMGFAQLCERSHSSARSMITRSGALLGVEGILVLACLRLTHAIAVRLSLYMGVRMKVGLPSLFSRARACTSARNSPTLFVVSRKGPFAKIIALSSVLTPLYSMVPVLMLHAASTQMDGMVGGWVDVRQLGACLNVGLY